MKSIAYLALFIFLFVLNIPTAFARLYDEDGLYDLKPLLTDSTFNVSAELGALFTTGNTESSSILSKFAVEYEMDHWLHKYTFESLFTQYEQIDTETEKRTTVTSDERYKINAEAQYKITDTKSALVFWGNEFDRFNQYTSISSLVIGYNFRAIDGTLIELDLSIAPGYTFIESSDGSTENAPVIRSSATYKWIVNSNARFTQDFSLETSSINTRIVSTSALTAKLHDSMQMKVSYQVTSDDDVDDGSESLNTQMSVTLVVNF